MAVTTLGVGVEVMVLVAVGDGENVGVAEGIGGVAREVQADTKNKMLMRSRFKRHLRNIKDLDRRFYQKNTPG